MYCPNCKQEFSGKFCPECGAKLIEKSNQDDLCVNISDNAAVLGGLNVTRNESHNTTSYDQRVINTSNVTNIVERQKTDTELRNERNIQYVEFCKQVFSDGIITETEKMALTTERIRLGIDETEAARLLEMVRKSAVTRMTTLGMRDAMTMKSIDRYIESNNTAVLETQISRLVALASNYKVDEVLCKYNMLLAALRPDELIREYETNAADEYWQTYWVAISYMKRGNLVETEKAILKLDLHPEYSEDNSLLLSALSTYCEYGANDASVYISAILPEHCSSLLMPFIHALFLIVSPERAKEVGADRTKCQFYIDNLVEIGMNKKEAEEAFKLAEDYYNALNGKIRNYKEAVRLYSKAADLGHAQAQYMLAECYASGLGLPDSDMEKAVEFYRKAAEQGNAKAIYSLAACYEDGDGVEEDYDKALELKRMAANAGNPDAMCALAEYYEYEEDNNEEALKWYNKAADIYREDAEKGNPYSMLDLYDCLTAIDCDDENAYDWHKKALDLLEKAAEQGDAVALYRCSSNFDISYNGTIRNLRYKLLSASLGYKYAAPSPNDCFSIESTLNTASMQLSFDDLNLASEFNKGEQTPEAASRYSDEEKKIEEEKEKIKILEEKVEVLKGFLESKDYKKALEVLNEIEQVDFRYKDK